MIYRMELRGKKPNDLLWIDFSYAVAALSIDIVENIIALRPHVVTQPGKNFVHSQSHSLPLKSTHMQPCIVQVDQAFRGLFEFGNFS